MAEVTTDNMLMLGEWNTLTVHRSGWNAWLQLNDGQQISGRSKVRSYEGLLVKELNLSDDQIFDSRLCLLTCWDEKRCDSFIDFNNTIHEFLWRQNS